MVEKLPGGAFAHGWDFNVSRSERIIFRTAIASFLTALGTPAVKERVLETECFHPPSKFIYGNLMPKVMGPLWGDKVTRAEPSQMGLIL